MINDILASIDSEINVFKQVRAILTGASNQIKAGHRPGGKRKISAAGRARIAAAQRARWAKQKAAK